MISFVVPAHNEAGFVGSTLEAIDAAAGEAKQRYEVIVVDDASTDATASIAAAAGASVLRVEHRQIATARNSGAAGAAGDLLVFVDADTLITGTVLGAALEAIRSGAVGGGASVRFDGRVPMWARPLLCSWLCVQRVFGFSTGCFLFCTRPAFDAAGRFDERLFAMEDVALSRALKRVGRFVVLREAVLTSGRSLRAHSFHDAVRMGWGFVRHGAAVFRTRRALDYWYGVRKDE